MLKKTLNEVIAHLEISPDGPVLIKSGALGLGTDMAFVTTVRNGKREVYLPGSSLKGVIRSHSEKICRTIQEKCVCEPFNVKKSEITTQNHDHISCSQVFKEKYWKDQGSAEHYRASCPACRMFGSLNFKGRCFIDDAYVSGTAPQPHIRDGVGIDRFSGAAKGGALYDFEVITDGVFTTKIHLVNFEMWQLDLLLMTLRDLCQGNIRIGMGTSRGLGKISAKVTQMEYHQWGRKPEKFAISDISVLEKNATERQNYAFDAPKLSSIALNTPENWQQAGIRYTATISQQQMFENIAPQITGTLVQFLDQHPERNYIKEHYIRS